MHKERPVSPIGSLGTHALLRASVICVFRGRGEKKTRFRRQGNLAEVETCRSSSRYIDHIEELL